MVNYYPDTLDEALQLLSQHDLRPFGGGTDLMVKYRNSAGILPSLESNVLFLNNITEIKDIEISNNNLVIGAGVTLEEVRVFEKTPTILKEILSLMASFAIRHEGTLAGNIGNASPAADTLPYLYCADARLTLASVEGTTEIAVQDYITGPGKTVRKPNQIITKISVPLLRTDTFLYKKVGGRRSDAISKLSFAGTAAQEGPVITDIRIAFGSVAPTVIRNRQLEKKLVEAVNNQSVSHIDYIVESYNKLIVPIDDQRSTAAYRKKCSINLLNSFIGSLFS